MKRFSPYHTYQLNGKIQHAFTAPDGKKKISVSWHADRIREIRYIFLQKNRDNQFRLKPYQKEIMTSILSGNDTFVILPTGSGKSLCFQAPSIFFPGITLVVTPLVALIENQVDNFNKNAYPLYHPHARNYYENIWFKAIYPGMNGLSAKAMFGEILNPRENSGSGRKIRYKFLYVSPERLCNPKFLRALTEAEKNGLSIDHIVIDEVHCMSQWGFDFRESYLHLPGFIGQRPVRPIISAFTATATPKDIAEIKNLLGFPGDPAEYASKKYREIIRIQERQNLSLRILPCDDTLGEKADRKDGSGPAPKTRPDALMDILRENRSRVCIIYRTTAAGVDELWHTLKNVEFLKDSVVKYHAQMSEQARRRSKRQFEQSYDADAKNDGQSVSSPKTCKNIMIATKAFGMGIDKKDISLVIHYDIPRSLEDYYQEVGRAGRDTEKIPMAQCWLLYSAGPKKEKGTLEYTISWIRSGKEESGSACMPISSRFSEKMKKDIYYWSCQRMNYVILYCALFAGKPGDAQDFIVKYLKNSLGREEIKRYLESRLAEEERSRITEYQKKLYSKPPEQNTAEYHTEIRRLISEVNELHINNTLVANTLRCHPEKYQLGIPYPAPGEAPGYGQEWKSKANKKVKGVESSSLRASDIAEDSAFIYLSNPRAREEYINGAWNMRQNKEQKADIIFTVDEQNIIYNIFKMQDSRWKLLTGSESLAPYQRYLGRDIKALFPKSRYNGWRSTKKNASGPKDAGTLGPAEADALFAYAPGPRPHELKFTLRGAEKLSYFDMCVLDAVYSIEAAGKETIYIQTIWELLTGRNPEYSSREKLQFRANIRNSIDKMRAMTISISDNQCGYEARDAIFLPLKEKPKGQKGYAYSDLPPLFRYAEEMNGEIIRVPVSLFNVAKVGETALWKDDFNTEFRHEGLAACSPDGNQKHAFDNQVKSLPLHMTEEAKLRELLSPKEYRSLESLRMHKYSFSPSMENALLCHYLLHRIAISKNTKRCNLISFDTIKTVTGICEDSCLFKKKIAALMNRYQNIGYLHRYYLYIANYQYRMSDGTAVSDTAYFRAKAAPVIKYWHLHGIGHLFCSDYTVTWSWQYNERLRAANSNSPFKTALVNALRRENRSLSADTGRELSHVKLGAMDGIVLQHK